MTLERFWMWLAYHLPRQLVSQCYLRVVIGAHLLGERLNEGRMTAMEALVLWEKSGCDGDWMEGDQ